MGGDEPPIQNEPGGLIKEKERLRDVERGKKFIFDFEQPQLKKQVRGKITYHGVPALPFTQ